MSELQNWVVKLQNRVRDGIPLGGQAILAGERLQETLADLAAYKTFLDSLPPFNTPGKPRNFPYSPDDVREQRARRERAGQLAFLAEQVEQELQPRISYLREALSLLPEEHPLAHAFQEAQNSILNGLWESPPGAETRALEEGRRRLDGLKQAYRESYLEAHRRARLNSEEDKRKRLLMKDPRLQQLRLLAERVPILPAKKLDDLEKRLSGLVSCWRLIPEELDREPRCPHCQFRPTEAPPEPVGETLRQLEEGLDRLRWEWVRSLSEALRSPTAQKSLELIAPEERARLEALRDEGRLPDLDEPFLQALAHTLEGLERVTLSPEEILEALTRPGMPCTADDLRQRWEKLLQQRLSGKDPSRVRIVIEW